MQELQVVSGLGGGALACQFWLCCLRQRETMSGTDESGCAAAGDARSSATSDVAVIDPAVKSGTRKSDTWRAGNRQAPWSGAAWRLSPVSQS